MSKFVHKVISKIVSEPAVTLGVVVAAVNATTVQTWQGYATAIVIALGRFAVSPAFGKARS